MADELEVTIAHSPDADDAFMFYALASDRIPTGRYRVRHLLADIQALNEAAQVGRYEVTAVSFHAYAHVADLYTLATCGASIGDGYGPIVVARKPLAVADLTRVVVAIPGRLTTAALALSLLVPGVETRAVPFDRIVEAVASGEVEAGLVIHEGQLTYQDSGLTCVVDLGVLWKEQTGLPLPLGGNAIRRDLGPATMVDLATLMRRSIDHGLAHRASALEHAQSYSRGTPSAKTDRFVSMYVNEYTRELGATGRTAVELLLSRAYEAKLIPRPIVLDFVAPVLAGQPDPASSCGR